MVTLKFSLTADEYLQYNYYTAWSAPDKSNYRLKYFLRVIILYGVVAAIYILTAGSHLLWVDISVFLFTGLAYLLLIPYLVKLSIRRKVKYTLSSKENMHVLDETEVELSENGIVDRDQVSESRYGWDAIVKKSETEDSYYLYTNSYHAIVIPKRVFSNQEQKEEADSLLNKYLPLSVDFPQN